MRRFPLVLAAGLLLGTTLTGVAVAKPNASPHFIVGTSSLYGYTGANGDLFLHWQLGTKRRKEMDPQNKNLEVPLLHHHAPQNLLFVSAEVSAEVSALPILSTFHSQGISEHSESSRTRTQ